MNTKPFELKTCQAKHTAWVLISIFHDLLWAHIYVEVGETGKLGKWPGCSIKQTSRWWTPFHTWNGLEFEMEWYQPWNGVKYFLWKAGWEEPSFVSSRLQLWNTENLNRKSKEISQEMNRFWLTCALHPLMLRGKQELRRTDEVQGSVSAVWSPGMYICKKYDLP